MFEAVIYPELLEPEFKPREQNYYCLHCIDVARTGAGWATTYQVCNHNASGHQISPASPHVDFTQGAHLYAMLTAWRDLNGHLQMDWERQLCSIQTVDDFLFECKGEME